MSLIKKTACLNLSRPWKPLKVSMRKKWLSSQFKFHSKFTWFTLHLIEEILIVVLVKYFIVGLPFFSWINDIVIFLDSEIVILKLFQGLNTLCCCNPCTLLLFQYLTWVAWGSLLLSETAAPPGSFLSFSCARYGVSFGVSKFWTTYSVNKVLS